jgi:small subunit ribosomal protein S11
MSTQKKKQKEVTEGIVFIIASFNNTIITVCDEEGNTLCWSSAGTAGFKGARKNTPFAAQKTAREAIEKALEFGLKKVQVIIKGRGSGRDNSIRAIKSAGLIIDSIEDQTPIPHNGCRPPKRRRL